MLIRPWPLWLALLTGVAGLAFGWEWRDRSADIQDLRTANAGLAAELGTVKESLEVERQKAQQLAAIAQQYEQDKTDAQAREASLRADLGNGERRLRREIGALYTSQLSGAAAHSAELAAAAQRGAEAVAAAIGVGAQCDARDKAWRAVAEEDRK